MLTHSTSLATNLRPYLAVNPLKNMYRHSDFVSASGLVHFCSLTYVVQVLASDVKALDISFRSSFNKGKNFVQNNVFRLMIDNHFDPILVFQAPVRRTSYSVNESR